MLRVAHRHVHDHVVAAGDEEGEAHLGQRHGLVEEAVDRVALVLGQPDHEQGLQPDAERPGIDLRVRAPQDAGVPHVADPAVGRGGGEPDRGGDLLHQEPRIVLQEPENGEVRSVQGRVGTHFP